MPLLPLLAAIASVALGALLALLPRVGPRAVGFVRTFALIAAITVVAGDLLPEAVDGIGLAAIAVVLVGIFLPGWIEHAFEERFKIGLELGFAALVLHHLADGVAIALYGDPSVVIALVAHTIPVIAVVVLRFANERGKKHAIIRAALLGAAIAVGVGIGKSVPAALLATADPWIAAAVSGLLLHVITHDLAADPPATHATRAIDFVAALAGVVLPIVASGFDRRIGDRFLALALDFAPPLLIAVVAHAVLKPKSHQVGAGAHAAWTLARRMLGLDAIIVAFVFLGPAYTMLYLGCAIAMCGAIGLLHRRGPARQTEALETDRGLIVWAIAGMMFAAFVGFDRTTFSNGDLAGGIAALLVMTAAPVPARIPLVAVLAHSGFPPSAAFASLLIDRTAVQEISEEGKRPVTWLIALAIAAAGGLAAAKLALPERSLRAPELVAQGCLAALVLFLAWSTYRNGARMVLAKLGASHEH